MNNQMPNVPALILVISVQNRQNQDDFAGDSMDGFTAFLGRDCQYQCIKPK
jgi:hypothetical protein